MKRRVLFVIHNRQVASHNGHKNTTTFASFLSFCVIYRRLNRLNL